MYVQYVYMCVCVCWDIHNLALEHIQVHVYMFVCAHNVWVWLQGDMCTCTIHKALQREYKN